MVILEKLLYLRNRAYCDLRYVSKFKFVRCGRVEKNRAHYLSRFNCGGPTSLKTLVSKY